MMNQSGFQAQQPVSYTALMDRLVNQPVGLTPGYTPPIPLSVPIPHQLQQLGGALVYHAVWAIQAEAQNSPLRILFFNVMSMNGYANPQFNDFMNKFMDLCIIFLTIVKDLPPEKIIEETAGRYVQYKVANQINEYQGLVNLLYPHIVGACKVAIQTFLNLAQNADNQAAMVSRQPVMNQQPFGGNFGGQQQVYQGNQGNFNGQQLLRPQPASLSSDRWSTGNSSSTSPPVSDQASRWGGTFQATPSLTPVPSPPDPAIQIRPTNFKAEIFGMDGKIISEAVQVISNQVNKPVTSPAPPPAVIAAPPPVASAYDPNLFAEEVVLTPQGKTVTRLKELPPMDREAHLGKPRHSPLWINPPTYNEFQQRIDASQEAEPEGSVMEIHEVNEQSLEPCIDKEELWARVNVSVVALRKTKAKIRAACIGALVIKPLPVSEKLLTVVDQIVKSKALEQAAFFLKSCAENAKGDDLIAFHEINDRLTQRANRMISNEMALDTGTITDFANDIEDQLKYLENKYGTEIVNLYKKQADKIITEALYYLKPSNDADGTYEKIFEAFFEDVLPDDEDKRPFIPFFCERLLLATVDLTSVEFKLELPAASSSALLTEDTAPFAFNIISKIMATKHVPDVSRILLRTIDNIVFQIDRGAFNLNALMVSLIS